MSLEGKIYEAIRDRVRARLDYIKGYRLFNNQLSNLGAGGGESVPFPCVLVQMASDGNENQASEVRQINYLITLYCGFESYEVDDLEVLNRLEDTKNEFDNYSLPGIGVLNWLETIPDNDHDNVLAYQMQFSLSACDASQLNRGKIKVSPWSFELVTDLDVDDPVIRTGDGDFTDE